MAGASGRRDGACGVELRLLAPRGQQPKLSVYKQGSGILKQLPIDGLRTGTYLDSRQPAIRELGDDGGVAVKKT